MPSISPAETEDHPCARPFTFPNSRKMDMAKDNDKPHGHHIGSRHKDGKGGDWEYKRPADSEKDQDITRDQVRHRRVRGEKGKDK